MANKVILCGGGIKSAVAAWREANEHELTLVHVSYGQPGSAAEMHAAGLLVKAMPNARLLALVLPHVKGLQRGEGDAPTTGAAGLVGTSTGEESEALTPAMQAGVFPMLLAVGIQAALRVGAHTVITGVTRGDNGTHLGLPYDESWTDRRREMLHAFGIALDALLPVRMRVAVESPLMDLGYEDIVQLAARFELPVEDYWTCSASGLAICGACDQCRARSNAFTRAGRVDPALTTASSA